ncbi:maturase K [Gossypium australe]|uniref:Maturase K n=1 Tax=Gossypium australe TaxID=47621 RepID=A0A5B6W7E7_9ROSI|nr:maturase K [Gossypium australe]
MYEASKVLNEVVVMAIEICQVAAANDVASNAPAPAQETVPVQSGLETRGQGEEAREAFLQIMSNWYTEYVQANPNAQPPPPLLYLSQFQWLFKKQGAEEFRSTIDDDPERAEFWLENSLTVFDELSCTPEESLKYDKTLTSVVPKERVTWDFFLEEFRKKYISQRFVDQKRKEFLELKQGKMIVAEYEREFVRLSKYAQECVSTEAILCKRFEDRLNEDSDF